MVPAMIDTKLMTRETYTLYGIEGDFGNKDGKLTFTEKVRWFCLLVSFVLPGLTLLVCFLCF